VGGRTVWRVMIREIGLVNPTNYLSLNLYLYLYADADADADADHDP
jgi:hypothetical protein